MNVSNNLFDQIGAMRQATIAVLDQLNSQAQAFDLPTPPATLPNSRRKLIDTTYTVLVIGEAKRGKSTFVNALIGRDILPTDVDIATSQVFRVRQAEHEAYRIRFEDESLQQISAAELSRYGSQVVADSIRMPSLGEVIRWIEIDTPMRFVPRGVVLLDTPGLGSLYTAHAQITQRFVPHADAVIFVLDSSKPIGQSEIAFIDSLLGITKNLFFIQTKIDQYLTEQWQAILRRNQDILVQQFSGRLADTRIWPISSINLMQAAQTGDDDYRQVSRHCELEHALEAFLFRVAGWSRAAEAIIVAENYHHLAAKALSERLIGLASDSSQQPVDQNAMQRRQQFEADWGERGKKRRKLLTSIRTVTTAGKGRFLDALQPGGEIEIQQRKAIDTLNSIEAAHRFGEALAGEVVGTAMAKWRGISEETFTQCTELLAPFLEAVDEMMFPLEAHQPVQIEIGSSPIFGAKDGLWDKVRDAQIGFLRGSESALVGINLAYMIGASAIIPMVTIATFGVVLVAMVGIVGMVRGWKFAEREQIEMAQADLHAYLATVLQETRQRFLSPNLEYNGLSLIEKQFGALTDTITEHVETIAQKKSVEASEEIARLSEMVQLGGSDRTAKLQQSRQDMAEWEAIGRTIQAIGEEIKLFDQLLKVT